MTTTTTVVSLIGSGSELRWQPTCRTHGALSGPRRRLNDAARTAATHDELAHARATLSQVASAVDRIQSSHAEAAGYDAGFDAGEFSGPAHSRAVESETAALLAQSGWTADEYEAEMIARTSERWYHYNGPSVDFLFAS